MQHPNARLWVKGKVRLESPVRPDGQLGAFAPLYSFLILGTSYQGDIALLGYNGRKAERLQVWKVLLFSPGEKIDDQIDPNSKCQPGNVNFNPGFSGRSGSEAQRKKLNPLPYTAPFL